MAVDSPPPTTTTADAPRRRSRRRWIIAGVVVVVLGVGAYLVFGYFAFQTLFLDSKVSEAAPAGRTTTLKTGMFQDRDHDGKGTVDLLRDGSTTYVRFEPDFKTSNGPDLFAVVYLGNRRVELAGLKGNIGSQNYALPASIDPGSVTGVGVWCKRFDATFTVADLKEPR